MNVALLTKSYLPDLRRCELLVESTQRCCPDLTHYLIVDRADLPAFEHLGDRAEIVVAEDLLPFRTHRTGGSRKLWLNRHSGAARGWIMQQVLKIEAARQLESEYFLFCDSDVAFIRPFDPDRLAIGGKVGLHDVDFVNDDVVVWTDFAARVLGLPAGTIEPRGHVGELVCWSRAHVRSLTDRIEEVTGAPWYRVLLRARTLSEYVLYGVYVRHVIGYDASDHVPSSDPLCRGLWEVELTDERIEEFFADLSDENVAVMIYSKGGADPDRYLHHLEALWSSSSNGGDGDE